MILCPVEMDSNGFYPSSVSVTLNPCDQATNNLKIIDNHPPNGVKKEFGYCGKYLNYKDRSFGMRFIEWIHALKILGNEKVYLYNRVLHPDVEEMMKVLEEKDMLELTLFKEPSGPRWIPYYASLIQINLFTDCFYRIRNLYKYVVIIDVDELLIPTQKDVKNWHELLEQISKIAANDTDLFSFKMITFPNVKNDDSSLKNIPNHNYILRHIKVNISRFFPFSYKTFKLKNLLQRAKFFFPWIFYTLKSVIIPDRVELLHQHEAIKCIGRDKCVQKKVWPNIAQINHYRSSVKKRIENYTIKDTKMWKIKGQLIKDVEKFLKETNYEP